MTLGHNPPLPMTRLRALTRAAAPPPPAAIALNHPPLSGRGGDPAAPAYDEAWGYRRPVPVTNARPLGGQFRRCYPGQRVGVLSDEIRAVALGNPIGAYAPWHADLLAERATWGLDEAPAA